MNPDTQKTPAAGTCDVCVYFLKDHGCCNSASGLLNHTIPVERTCGLFIQIAARRVITRVPINVGIHQSLIKSKKFVPSPQLELYFS